MHWAKVPVCPWRGPVPVWWEIEEKQRWCLGKEIRFLESGTLQEISEGLFKLGGKAVGLYLGYKEKKSQDSGRR